MAKTDLTSTNNKVTKKSKISFICVGVFVLLGIIIMAVFGFNTNYEFTGYYEVEVKVGIASSGTYASKIGKIVNEYGGKYEGYQVAGEGENKTIIVRYLNELSQTEQKEVNGKISKLSTEQLNIVVLTQNGEETGHVKVGSVVTVKDYLFTTLTCLLLIIVAAIFSYIRYNGASAMTILGSCLAATLGLLCLTAILRITVGQNFFAMITVLNLLVVYGCINFFENIKETSWLHSGNFTQAKEEGLKKSHFRFCVLSIAIFAIGLLFAIIAPSSIKYISLSILFVSVTMLAVLLYVMPLLWSLFIKYKKVKTEETTKIEK